MTVQSSFVRNLVKVVPLLLVVDTLVMLLAFRKDAQRISDRIAQTLVVRS